MFVPGDCVAPEGSAYSRRTSFRSKAGLLVVIGAGECEDYFDSRGFGTNAAVTDNSDVHAATCSNGQIDFRSA